MNQLRANHDAPYRRSPTDPSGTVYAVVYAHDHHIYLPMRAWMKITSGKLAVHAPALPLRMRPPDPLQQRHAMGGPVWRLQIPGVSQILLSGLPGTGVTG